MKTLWSYCRRCAGMILLYLLFGAVFAAVTLLYEQPPEAVLYAEILCACLGMLFFTVGYLRFSRRHRLLRELLNRITLTTDELPADGDRLEQDYQALVRAVHADKTAAVSALDRRASERLDYYTLWAHQIKTPIAAMRLLLQSEGEADTAELQQELFRIEQYVGMVLQYLRLDSDTTDYVIQRYDLDGIVRQAVRKYAGQFIRRHLQLDYSGLNTTVLTDEKWLLFVIEQLLSNALKYTPSGCIRIYMIPGQTLVIEDSGIGIQPEDLPRVWDKGFTGYNGRTDKKSTGIGLYLCRRICHKLGHTLRMESTVGQGTRVYLGLAEGHVTIE